MVPPPGHGPFTGTVADWPLWFVRHEFGVSTYSTYGCKVIYNNFMRVNEPDDVLQSSSEAIGAKYPNNMRAGYSSIANFPPPAIVTWRSKDGTPHHAEVDIGDIRSEEHTSELQSLMRISYAVFCLNKKKQHTRTQRTP